MNTLRRLSGELERRATSKEVKSLESLSVSSQTSIEQLGVQSKCKVIYLLCGPDKFQGGGTRRAHLARSTKTLILDSLDTMFHHRKGDPGPTNHELSAVPSNQGHQMAPSLLDVAKKLLTCPFCVPIEIFLESFTGFMKLLPVMELLMAQLLITGLSTSEAISNPPLSSRNPHDLRQKQASTSDLGGARSLPCTVRAGLSEDLTKATLDVTKTLNLGDFYVVFEDEIDLCLLRSLWNKGLGLKTVTTSHWWNAIRTITYQQTTQHLLIGTLTWITDTLVKVKELFDEGSLSSIYVAERISSALLDNQLNGVVLFEERRIPFGEKSPTVDGYSSSSSFSSSGGSLMVNGPVSRYLNRWVTVGSIETSDASYRRISLAATWTKDQFRVLRPLWPRPLYDFRGETVRIACLQKDSVFQFDDGEVRLSHTRGYLAEVVKIMMWRLNLTGSLVLSDGGGSRESDGTWGGIVGVLTRNEAAIGALDFTPSASRSEVVDFTIPIGEDPTIIYSSAPVILVKPFLLLQIFSKEVWGCLTALMFVGSFALWGLGRAESEMGMEAKTTTSTSLRTNPQQWERMKKKKRQASVFKYFMMVFKILVLQNFMPVTTVNNSFPPTGTGFLPRGSAGRLVTALICMVALIMWSLYNGSITAFLVIPFKSKPINTVENLLASEVTPVVRGQTNILTNTVNKKEGALYPAKSRVVVVEGEEVGTAEFQDKVAKGIYALVDVFSSAVGNANQYSKIGEKCKFHISRDNVQVNPDALAVRRNSPYLVQIDFMIRSLQYFGIMEYVKKKHVTVLCETELSRDGPKPMSLLQAQGPFIVLVVGFIAAVLILIAEVLWQVIHRNPVV
ncbi:glutamate receptor 1-like [Palaemon carinicauda]|uniref:glutamate receptor 1-like n=1 Tax=Palaemon carinicauda TaxID=392227 RepID=UPI0035B5C17B